MRRTKEWILKWILVRILEGDCGREDSARKYKGFGATELRLTAVGLRLTVECVACNCHLFFVHTARSSCAQPVQIVSVVPE